MCGHVGIAGKLEFRDESLMKRLFVFDYFRGPDSTGLAAITNGNIVKIAKAAVGPIDLFDMKKFSDALSGSASKVFLGHNRLATKGIVNNVNAHPYQYGNIVGAHNGTLDEKSWKALEAAVGEKFAVDSQAVIYAIDKLGIEETMKLMQGAWALVWVNMADPALDGKPSLNFIRNKERPLWYSFSNKFDKIIWASEWVISHAATSMTTHNQQKQELHQNPDGTRFWSFKEDTHYRFDLELLRKGGTEFPACFMQELKGKEPTPAVSYSCGSSNFPAKTQATGGTTSGKMTTIGKINSTTTLLGKGTTKKSTGFGTTSKARTELTLKGDKDNHYAGVLDPFLVAPLLRHGCSWCGAPIMATAPGGITIFEESGVVHCEECSGHGDRVTIHSSKPLDELVPAEVSVH